MPKDKKGRESAMPRGSQYIDGQLIHTATNQKLYFQSHICTVYRETLKPTEDFSKRSAIQVMDKHLKKRQAHCTGNLLEDRFALEKNKGGKDPFRTFLYYREIVDYQRSAVKPEYFVLSVDSEKSGSRYYEVYKTKNKDDARKVEGFIKQAMQNPNKRIADGPVIDVVPVVENNDVRRSLVHLDFQTSVESLDDNDHRSTIYQITSPTPPRGVDYSPPSPPAVRRYSPIPSPVVQRQQKVMAYAPPQRSPPRQRSFTPPTRIYSPSPPRQRRQYSMNDLNDVTYISFDPRTRRPMVSDNGPVFMYMMRQEAKQGEAGVGAGRTGASAYNSTIYNGGDSNYYRY